MCVPACVYVCKYSMYMEIMKARPAKSKTRSSCARDQRTVFDKADPVLACFYSQWVNDTPWEMSAH